MTVGFGIGQLLTDRQRRFDGLDRLGRLTGAREHDADVTVAGRQGALEVDDGGVGVGQLLEDRPRRLVGLERVDRLAVLIQQVTDGDVRGREFPLEVERRCGSTLTSFWRIASDDSRALIASSVFPVSPSRAPKLSRFVASSP